METGYQGQQLPGDGSGSFGAQAFLINQLLSRVNTATLVKVVAVTNSGGVAAVGFVDVKPLVNLVDGAGNGKQHGILHKLPYFRLQGGANAIILDPIVGDIGIAVFADKDISKVKNTKKEANPGSGSRHSMSDGLYIGGVLNGVPTQYVQFSSSGITVHSPTKVTLEAPITQIDSPSIILNGALQQGKGSNGGDATLGGTLTADVDVVANGKSLRNHVHSGVVAGGANTGVPV